MATQRRNEIADREWMGQLMADFGFTRKQALAMVKIKQQIKARKITTLDDAQRAAHYTIDRSILCDTFFKDADEDADDRANAMLDKRASAMMAKAIRKLRKAKSHK